MSLFRIRREVMDALDEHARAQFHERMVTRMRAGHDEICAALGLDRVIDEVERGIGRATRYGIFDESDIEAFLHLLFERGFDFDQHTPWARRILDNGKLSGAAKIGFIVELAE